MTTANPLNMMNGWILTLIANQGLTVYPLYTHALTLLDSIMTLTELIFSLRNFDHPEIIWTDVYTLDSDKDIYPEGYPDDQKFLVDLGGDHITHSFWTNERHWGERMMVVRWCPVPDDIEINA